MGQVFNQKDTKWTSGGMVGWALPAPVPSHLCMKAMWKIYGKCWKPSPWSNCWIFYRRWPRSIWTYWSRFAPSQTETPRRESSSSVASAGTQIQTLLMPYFPNFGKLEEGAVIMDNTGKSKGYGFVTFKHMDGALNALNEPSKKIDGCRHIIVMA